MKNKNTLNIECEMKKTPRMVVCKRCGKEKIYHAKDLCELCYAIVRNGRSKIKKDFQLI
jgi:hypothetical protein